MFDIRDWVYESRGYFPVEVEYRKLFGPIHNYYTKSCWSLFGNLNRPGLLCTIYLRKITISSQALGSNKN